MKLTKIVFCLLLLGGMSLGSCVREDFDGCYSKNKLLLSYKGDGTEEIFPEKICRVEMYVFDAENKCVNSTVLPQEQVANRTALLPPLEAGNYRIVCLGNTHHTKVKDVEKGDYSHMLFASEDYIDGQTVVSGNDSLYYATTSYTVLPFTGRNDEQGKIMEFASSHYDLSVEVAGVPAMNARGENEPVIEVKGVTPYTDFENQVKGDATNYLLETEYEPENLLLTARTNIMRHKNHEDVFVTFRMSGDEEPLAEVNLGEFLAANPIIDCSKHEVLIPIRIEFKEGNVTISLPEWYVEQVKPEF